MKSGGMVDMKKLKERGKDRWVHVSSEGLSLLQYQVTAHNEVTRCCVALKSLT